MGGIKIINTISQRKNKWDIYFLKSLSTYVENFKKLVRNFIVSSSDEN